MKGNYHTDLTRFQNSQTRAKVAYNLGPEEIDGQDSNQNLKNQQIDILCNELEQMVIELTQQQNAVKQYTDRQKFDWLSEKESYLTTISRQLDQNSLGASQVITSQCENLLLKVQKMLRKMATQQTLEQTPDYQFTPNNNQQPPINRIEEIKKREEKLDKDFIKLVERYNNSKGQIETLTQNVPLASQEANKYFNIQDQGTQEHLKNDKNIKRLKQTISLKENLVSDKLQQQKQINEELKEALRDHLSKFEAVEEALKVKDEILQKYQKEIKQCQEDLAINMEKFKEMRIREEEQLRKEEDLLDLQTTLQERLQKKKIKIQNLKEKQQETNKLLEDFKGVHDVESQRMKETIEDLEQKNNQLESKLNDNFQVTKQLREELSHFQNQTNSLQTQHAHVQQLHGSKSQQLEQAQEQIAFLQSQILSLKDEQTNYRNQLTQQDQKMTKTIQKHETDKQNLIIEHQKQLQKKKEKIDESKQKNQQLVTNSLNLEKQIMSLQQQLENTQNLQQTSESNIQDLKAQLRETQLELKSYKDSHGIATNHSEKLSQQLVIHEENLKQHQINENIRIQNINELKSEFAKISDENHLLNNQLSMAENQLEYQQKIYTQQISDIETRVDNLIQELKMSKDETQELKNREQNLKKQLNQNQEYQNTQKEKYQKLKNTNKELKENLRQLEDKVKEFVIEKTVEQREQEKFNEYRRYNENSTKNKLKVLDGIQQMIKSHKSLSFKYD